jgi:hypothetical protein
LFYYKAKIIVQKAQQSRVPSLDITKALVLLMYGKVEVEDDEEFELPAHVKALKEEVCNVVYGVIHAHVLLGNQ